MQFKYAKLGQVSLETSSLSEGYSVVAGLRPPSGDSAMTDGDGSRMGT